MRRDDARRPRSGARLSLTVTQAVEDLVRAAVRLPDEAMDRPWAWGAYDEEGLRFALLMTHHELRDLAVRLITMRERAGRPMGESERIRAQYHEAYRDLTGLLHRLRDDELGREPAPGQWPVREAIRHMWGAVYGFSAAIELAVAARARGVALSEPTDEEFAKAKQQPVAQSELALADVRAVAAALFVAHGRARRAMESVKDEDLEALALFWDGPMPLRFRLHRFEEHMRQHTVQVEKTLLAIKHPATEAERLVRLIHGALAGVESATVPGVGDEDRAAVAATIASRVPALG